MNSLVVDLLLALLFLLALIRGYQRGLVVSLLGLVGFLAGAIVGLIIGPGLVDSLGPVVRLVALLSILLTMASLGQALTMAIARAVRNRLLWRPLRVLDSTVGAAFTIIGALLLVWASAAVLRVSPYPSVTTAVAGSRVITTIDAVVPDLARAVMAQARQVINEGQFPDVFSALGPEPFFDSSPPDAEVVATPGVRAASASVARVTGIARSCQREVEGSGFVIASGLVMTNAHVVAGVSAPRVLIHGDRREYAGEVVYFDPQQDVAIIHVPGLEATALRIVEGERGSDAVVAGYPQNGPFTLGAARIKGAITAIGWDIYSRERVRRDVLAISAVVRPGNSGGPLLSSDGAVVGMVFARSTTDGQTGYALNHEEIGQAIRSLGSERTEVPAGRCA